MKSISFSLTLIIHFIIATQIKLLDNLGYEILILLGGIFIGLAIKTLHRNERAQKMGWGIMFGSLTALLLLGIFFIWLVVVL